MIKLHGPVPILPECNLWLGLFETPIENQPVDDDLAASKLSPRDLARWRRFRVPEKRTQFLQSRLTVREVLREELKDQAESLQLESDETGRPRLFDRENKEVHSISLSHSGTVIAVAFARGTSALGVDVEIVEPVRTIALKKMMVPFFQQEGPNGPVAGDEPEFLRSVWTVGESLWKSLGGIVEMQDCCVFLNDQGSLSAMVRQPRHLESASYQTRLFATAGNECFPDTVLVSLDPSINIRFRGCVTRYVSNAPRQ